MNGQAQARPAIAASPEPQIIVHLYNYAGVRPAALLEANSAASGLLTEAGVKTEWLDCTPGSPARPSEDACAFGSRTTHVQMNLMKGDEGNFKGRSRTALGFSVLPDEQEPGTVAYISMRRVHRVASPDVISEGKLIGLAMAHELGHLLLGTNAHAFEGIMRANWRVKDLEDPAHSGLHFTAGESKRLHAAADARKTQDEARVSAAAKLP
jgi:hypothetical protein